MDMEDTQATEVADDIAPAEPEGGDEGGQATPGGPTRKERRQSHWQETKARAAEAEALRQENEAMRAEQQRQAEMIAELRGRTEAIQMQTQRQEISPEDRVETLREQATDTLRALNETKDQDTAKRLLKQWFSLNDQIQDVRLEARDSRLRETLTQNMPDPVVMAQRSTVETEFPWMSTNAAAREAAIGYEKVLISRGKPANMATSREAILMAARDHGLGGDSGPSATSKQRFSLPSSRDAGGSEGNSRTVAMNDGLKKMAEAMYPSLEAPAAWAKWAAGPGQRMLAKQTSK